jgi:hypothetical protein
MEAEMNGLVMLGLWTLVGAVIALLAGWSPALKWANENAGFSSWVKAVGSVAAIGLAVWVVQRQHRLELRRQAIADWQTKRAALQGALQVMSGVYSVAEKIASIGCVRPPVLMDLFHLAIELEVLVSALSRTDYLRFETHSAIEGLSVSESLGKALLHSAKKGHERMRQADAPDHWPAIVARANECAAGIKVRTDRLYADIVALEPPPKSTHSQASWAR